MLGPQILHHCKDERQQEKEERPQHDWSTAKKAEAIEPMRYKNYPQATSIEVVRYQSTWIKSTAKTPRYFVDILRRIK